MMIMKQKQDELMLFGPSAKIAIPRDIIGFSCLTYFLFFLFCTIFRRFISVSYLLTYSTVV